MKKCLLLALLCVTNLSIYAMEDSSSSNEEVQENIPSISNPIINKYKLLDILPRYLDEMLNASDTARLSIDSGMPWMLNFAKTCIKNNSLNRIIEDHEFCNHYSAIYHQIAFDEVFIEAEEQLLEQIKEQQDDWRARKNLIDNIGKTRLLILFGIVKKLCPDYQPPEDPMPDHYHMDERRIAIIYPNRNLDKDYFPIIFSAIIADLIAGEATWREETMRSVYDHATTKGSCLTPLY